jgi:hypothetical protein
MSLTDADEGSSWRNLEEAEEHAAAVAVVVWR